ncbi:MAG: methyltransferase [Chloroflexota bacterium]
MLDRVPGAQQFSEEELLHIAIKLGAIDVGGPMSAAEHEAASRAEETQQPSRDDLDAVRAEILLGQDPLGDRLRQLRPTLQRRALGAFYTPSSLVEPMIEWVLHAKPDRLVDAGCGSGRFASAAVRRAPNLRVVAVDIDPTATLFTRAVLAVLGCRDARVLQHDYTTLKLGRIEGRTAFVGNPPYVRHHLLSKGKKAWAARTGRWLGCRVSGLSGLHAYFYLATALHSRPGDVGCFVTSAEWLDVGYGAAIRDLLLNGLGGQALHVVDSRVLTFDDAQTTAVVSCFVVGDTPETIRVRLVDSPAGLRGLDLGEPLPREAFLGANRWSPLFREANPPGDMDQMTELGSIARVHRGLVTGGNDFFVLTRRQARELGLERWCRPAITAGREILEANGTIRNTPDRKLLLDVPRDVDRSACPALDAYLRLGETPRNGRPAVADGYICSHRKPWWFLGCQAPAPIVASYMARQAPVFALNPDGLALLNIGHGVYPREKMDPRALERLVAELNDARHAFRGLGRTYQGGLEKFEPREMEALPIRLPNVH